MLTASAKLLVGDNQLVLREWVPSDLGLLKQIYASTRESELAQVPWPDEQKAAFIEQQFNAQHDFYQKTFANAEFLIIELEGQGIGRLYIDRRDEEIRLIDIALLPAWRGTGFGTHILRELQSEARQTSRVLRIHVEKNNPAMALYLRLGFKAIEDQGVYELMEWNA